MRNLELKVRCPDDAALHALAERARAGGAVYVNTMGQRDIYFTAPCGRLKLREWWREEDGGGDVGRAGLSYERGEAGAALISYARPDHSGSRFSDYRVYPVEDPQSILPVLTGALEPRATVEKRRALYRYGDTRIHFDRVAGLGAFVELETVLADNAEIGEAEHREVIALLELDDLPAVAGSYVDLATGGR